MAVSAAARHGISEIAEWCATEQTLMSMTPFLWSQIVAACAFLMGLISYQFRQRQSVLMCLTGLALLNSCHFLLLDRLTPAVIMLLTGTRYVTAMYTQRRILVFLFLVAAVVTLLLTWNGPLNLLALAGVFCGTIGSFQKSDPVMRLCFMNGNCCWLIHNLLAGTPVATVMEASFLASNILGYWRIHGSSAGRS